MSHHFKVADFADSSSCPASGLACNDNHNHLGVRLSLEYFQEGIGESSTEKETIVFFSTCSFIYLKKNHLVIDQQELSILYFTENTTTSSSLASCFSLLSVNWHLETW